LASLGSALTATRGESSSRFFICRVGGRGGAKRSAKREVGGGSGATGIGAPYRDFADDLRVLLTTGARTAAGASGAAAAAVSSSSGGFGGVFSMAFGAGFLAAGALTAGGFDWATGALAGALGAGARVLGVAFTGTLADVLEAARGADSVEFLSGDRATGVSSQRGLCRHNVPRECPSHQDGPTRPGHGAGGLYPPTGLRTGTVRVLAEICPSAGRYR
jgi:hypothetical protein